MLGDSYAVLHIPAHKGTWQGAERSVDCTHRTRKQGQQVTSWGRVQALGSRVTASTPEGHPHGFKLDCGVITVLLRGLGGQADAIHPEAA